MQWEPLRRVLHHSGALDQFEAADVLVAIAKLDHQFPGGPVRGTFTARYGPDNTFLGIFNGGEIRRSWWFQDEKNVFSAFLLIDSANAEFSIQMHSDQL
jgi:hypothetical protein